MAHLTKPTTYNIEDSNIALLGSDLERNVREHSGDIELAWDGAGSEVGLQIWRIEKFKVMPWSKDKHGVFYDGDSYIVLHTYKKDPESEALSYDLHFWLGEQTTQDEAGTAAYKTVELDDHLHGVPIQYREVEGFESSRFLSYFKSFMCLRGGVSTGFHHVSEAPPLELFRLYRVGVSHGRGQVSGSHLLVREVPPEASSLVQGDVFVLDKGTKVLQLNTKSSVGKEKFKAAEFVQLVISERKGQCETVVYDEGASGYTQFLSEFGINEMPSRISTAEATEGGKNALFRLSDSIGAVTFEPVPGVSRSTLASEDAFLLDATSSAYPAIYVWVGESASLNERRLALQYAQRYLHTKRQEDERVRVAVSIVKMKEGYESEEFLEAIES